MTKKGQLLIFEGPDGVGKSALAKALGEQLRSRGVQCECLAFPGNAPGTLGHLVYEIHHEPGRFEVESMSPTSLQLLHVAAHIDAIQNQIQPLLESGTCIILDRFWWSTWVYGRNLGIPPSLLKQMLRPEWTCWGRTKPTAAFVITRKSALRDETGPEKWETLSGAYSELADHEKRRYPVFIIDNSGTFQDSLRRVMECLEDGYGKDTSATANSRPAQRCLSFDQAAGDRSEAQLAPHVFTRLSPARPTVVYDTYWRFAAERQDIFFRRLEGASPPWTTDPILRAHRFTNAYRASDRVSQYLIGNVIYKGNQSPEEVYFRTILFRLFNRIETWRLLLGEMGEVTYSGYSYKRYDGILTHAMRSRRRIYSPAYIMPSGKTSFGSSMKHRNCLKLLEQMMADGVPKKIKGMPSMRRAFELLRSYPMIGDFLGYQFVTDLNYSRIIDFSEMEFVIPGPGAKGGISKCFSNLGGLNGGDIIRLMADRQQIEFERLGITFRSLWGRPLQLIDCQNLFCEVDKYARLAHPEVQGVGGRTRIKQRYRPNPEPIDYWFPPKWNLNESIEEWKRKVKADAKGVSEA